MANYDVESHRQTSLVQKNVFIFLFLAPYARTTRYEVASLPRPCLIMNMYLRFRGCPVVLDIELSVSTWYHKTRRVMLHARRLLLLLLLAAESKERRLAVCGITFKLSSNGAETK